MVKKLKLNDWVFCEDVQKWYKYEYGHLKLPSKFNKDERGYYLKNLKINKNRKNCYTRP